MSARVTKSDRLVAVWLFGLAGMVLVQVLLGGITRLSESGLSIMEWAPILGVFPPLSDSEWQRVFEIYRQTGEYRLVNADIDLSGFKAIFWWEYIHRLWARALALALFVPYVWLWLRRRLDARWLRRLALIFVLGGLQGAVGWIMVASGFSERTDVSQYRLLAHLLLALLIYAVLLWWAFSLMWPSPAGDERIPAPRMHSWLLVGLIALEIGMGGLVAGLNAGLIYNTFPLMGSGLIPSEIGFVDPWWRDPFENPATVQFLHRTVALLVAVTGIVLVVRAWRLSDSNRNALSVFLVLLFFQVGLGVATLVLQVPTVLAVAHQACAFLLFGQCLYLAYRWSRVKVAKLASSQVTS